MIRLPGTMTRIADCCNCLSSLAPVTEGPAWSAEKPLRPFGGAGTREAVAAAHPVDSFYPGAPTRRSPVQPFAPRPRELLLWVFPGS